jgi:hypothetical protein
MTIFLPKKNDRFKAKLKDHEKYYFACGHVLICVKWTQMYVQKGRKRSARARFCEAMPESKLSLPPKLRTADFKLDRSVWSFEAVNEAPSVPVEPRTQAGPIVDTHEKSPRHKGRGFG